MWDFWDIVAGGVAIVSLALFVYILSLRHDE